MFKIRKLEKQDLGEAVKLISDVFMKFEAPDYTVKGVQSFFDTALNNTDFINKLTFYGGFYNETLIGVIATRNNGNHIALFFVKEDFHRQGVGRKLFNTVLANSKAELITVNSSPYAKEFYHKLGFVDSDKEQNSDGIRFIPMQYKR